MTVKELSEMGFIYKRLTKHLYLVRLYANKNNPLHRIIFPMFIAKGEETE